MEAFVLINLATDTQKVFPVNYIVPYQWSISHLIYYKRDNWEFMQKETLLPATIANNKLVFLNL